MFFLDFVDLLDDFVESEAAVRGADVSASGRQGDLGGQIAREEEWDFLKNGSYGVFSSEKLKEFGTAVLNKMCTIGIIICLLVVIAIIAIIQNRKK